jgi:hypothetical protein
MKINWIEIVDILNNQESYSIEEGSLSLKKVDEIVIQKDEIIIKGSRGLNGESADKIYLKSNIVRFSVPKDTY